MLALCFRQQQVYKFQHPFWGDRTLSFNSTSATGRPSKTATALSVCSLSLAWFNAARNRAHVARQRQLLTKLKLFGFYVCQGYCRDVVQHSHNRQNCIRCARTLPHFLQKIQRNSHHLHEFTHRPPFKGSYMGRAVQCPANIPGQERIWRPYHNAPQTLHCWPGR